MRQRGPRASSALRGVAREQLRRGICERCRYVADITISLCSALTSQPDSTKLDGQPVEQLRDASGSSPARRSPRSVSTMPRPKCICQTRLTNTRAVSGWRGSNSQLREPEPVLRQRLVPREARRQAARRHLLAGRAVDAAIQHERRRGSGRVAHHEHLRHARSRARSRARARRSARLRAATTLRVVRRRAAPRAAASRSARAAPASRRAGTRLRAGVRSRSNTRSSSRPLPTGVFSRKRVPNGEAENGSKTSADVNGRIAARQRVALRLSRRGRRAVQVEREPGGAARAVVGERDVRPLADG